MGNAEEQHRNFVFSLGLERIGLVALKAPTLVAVFAIIATILQSVTFLPLIAIYNLAMLFPTAGMGARRLQDIGRDGKLIWIFLIAGFISQIIAILTMMSWFWLGFLSFFLFGPMVVLINLALLVACVVLIYFWCQPGDPGDNAYGPPPPVFDPSVKPAV